MVELIELKKNKHNVCQQSINLIRVKGLSKRQFNTCIGAC